MLGLATARLVRSVIGTPSSDVVVAAARAAAERQQRRVGLILLAVELAVAGRDDRRNRARR